MPPPVIVDTNVVVAGLLTARADSPVAQVLDGMLAAAFPFAISDALLAEYRKVLRRPALRKAHGLTLDELDILLLDLAQHGIVIAPMPAEPAPDPTDQHLWEMLAAREDLLLVTGEKKLQRDRAMTGRILTPAAFVERWLGANS